MIAKRLPFADDLRVFVLSHSVLQRLLKICGYAAEHEIDFNCKKTSRCNFSVEKV